jgi:hypothetical protein
VNDNNVVSLVPEPGLLSTELRMLADRIDKGETLATTMLVIMWDRKTEYIHQQQLGEALTLLPRMGMLAFGQRLLDREPEEVTR